MPLATCPRLEDLSALQFGTLSAPNADEVAEHLDECPDCQAAIASIDDSADSLVSSLRQPLAQESFENEPELDRALAAVEALGAKLRPPVGGAHDAPPVARDQLLGTLREYQLLEELGEGGMGTVYKARHAKLKRIVALKVLPRDRMRDAQAIARFEREMEAVGKLEHPNIVRALDAGEHNGTHYLVMEFIDGLDLSKLVQRLGKLPIADACELVRQAAVALQHAHEHGLVHRDIKPSNLMLTTAGTIAGQVKLLDLGLALLAGPQSTAQFLTVSNQMMGTADFIAPEQVGDSHAVDIRADLYSLGCTLYKLLTGEAPFSGAKYGSSLQKMLAHRRETIPPVTDRRPDVPSALAAVLDRMAAKMPSERFGTPAEVAAVLAPFCAGSDLAALARRADPLRGCPGVSPSVDSPLRSAADALAMRQANTDPFLSNSLTGTHPSGAVGNAVLGVPAAACSPSPVHGSLTSPPTRRPPRRLRVAAAAAASLLMLAGVLVFMQTNKGTVRIEINDPAIKVLVDGNAAAIKGAKPEEIELRAGLHGLRIKYGELDFETDEFILNRRDTVILKVDLLPGKLQVVQGDKVLGERTIARTDTIVPPATDVVQAPEAGDSSTWSVAELPEKVGFLRRVPEPNAYQHDPVILSRDGRLIGVPMDNPGFGPDFFRVIETVTGRTIRDVGYHHERLVFAQFLPDGKQVLLSSTRDYRRFPFRLWDLESGTERQLDQIPDTGHGLYWYHFSDNAKRLALSVTSPYKWSGVRVIDVESGTSLLELPRPPQSEGSARVEMMTRLSGNGEQAITAFMWNLGDDGLLWKNGQLRIDNLDGNAQPRLIDVTNLRYHPNPFVRGTTGEVAALCSRKGEESWVEYWDAASGKSIRRVPFGGKDAPIAAIAVSGTRVADIDVEKRIHVYDLPTGNEVFGTDPLPPIEAGLISDDGRMLAFRAGGELWFYRLPDLLGGPKAKTVVEKGKQQPAAIKESEPIEIQRFVGHTQVSLVASVAADGTKLLTGGMDDRTVRLWEVATGEKLRCWQRERSIEMAAISPDGTRVAWIEGVWPEQRLMVADVEGLNVVGPLGNSRRFWWVVWAHDNQYLITGDEDGVVREWDADTNKMVREFPSARGPVKQGAVSRDGQYVAAMVSDTRSTVWERATGNRVVDLVGTNVYFAPDSRSVYLNDPKAPEASRCSLPDGKELCRYGANVYGSLPTANGQYLVTQDRDYFGNPGQTLRVLRTDTGVEIGKLGPFGTSVSLLALAPDGRSAFVLPHDGTGWHGFGSVVRQVRLPGLPPEAPSLAVAPFDAEQAKGHQEAWAKHLGTEVEITNTIGMKLRLIPPGEFMMGSPKAEIDELIASTATLTPEVAQNRRSLYPQEGPQHRVRLTKGFYVGSNEVTQQQFQDLMGNNPSSYSIRGPESNAVEGLVVIPVEKAPEKTPRKRPPAEFLPCAPFRAAYFLGNVISRGSRNQR